jgi:hypothetical protein
VYKTVSQQCNGRITCMFKADVKTLNVDPLHSCFKKLNVRYRCFSYDRLWNLEISQGKNLEIDCHDEDTKEDSAS